MKSRVMTKLRLLIGVACAVGLSVGTIEAFHVQSVPQMIVVGCVSGALTRIYWRQWP